MEGFQITSLVLLSLLVVLLITCLVLAYKAIIRRDTAINRVQSSLDASMSRLVEVESALKSNLPAIERNTGESSKQLVEVAAALKLLVQSQLEALSLMRSDSSLHISANSVSTKLLVLTEEIASVSREIKTSNHEGVTAVRDAGSATEAKLEQLSQEFMAFRKQLDEVTRF